MIPRRKGRLNIRRFFVLPDLESALEYTRTREQAQRLLDLAETKLKRLEEELAELIRMRDYRFLKEPREKSRPPGYVPSDSG